MPRNPADFREISFTVHGSRLSGRVVIECFDDDSSPATVILSSFERTQPNDVFMDREKKKCEPVFALSLSVSMNESERSPRKESWFDRVAAPARNDRCLVTFDRRTRDREHRTNDDRETCPRRACRRAVVGKAPGTVAGRKRIGGDPISETW